MYYLLCFLFCFLVFGDCSADLKSVQGVYCGAETHWVGDGFFVRNYFPNHQLTSEQTSPFVLLDYNAPKNFKPSFKHRGVGAHPHKGFETVTFVYSGKVAHRDSVGNVGIIGPGDVQWMTAGSGVLHEEFQETNFSKKGGVLHAVQLWVNLPAKDKLCSPRYQTLLNSDIRQIKLDQNGSSARIIAGNYNGVQGSAETHTPIEVYELHLKKGCQIELDLPKDYNTLLLTMKGLLAVNGKNVDAGKLVVFEQNGNKIKLNTRDDSFMLLMSGQPIDEPVVQSGPFVMNTQQEIKQAWEGFHKGLFGELK